MKANWKLFAGLCVFYAIMAVIYTSVTHAEEPVGITGMILASCLAGMVGFYIWFTQKRIGFDIPSDDLQGEIADDAGELGFYSPHSWWPLPVAVSACVTGLGLIIGWWLTLIGVGALLISIVGFVTEYEKPLSTPSRH
jgi:hypothetical protein